METKVTMSLKEYEALKLNAENQFQISISKAHFSLGYEFVCTNGKDVIIQEIKNLFDEENGKFISKMMEHNLFSDKIKSDAVIMLKYFGLPWYKRIFVSAEKFKKDTNNL